MFRSKVITGFVFLMFGLVIIVPFADAQKTEQSKQEAMYYRYLEFASYVKGGSIEPHWMADGSSFWYAQGLPDNTVIWKVDPVVNSKKPMFYIASVREALAEIVGHEMFGEGLLLLKKLECNAQVFLTFYLDEISQV